MLWCCSSKCSGNLDRVHGIMNSMKYKDILYVNLAAPVRKLKLCRGWIFRQDIDPKNTSKSTQKWLTEHKLKLLSWPSQSPWSKPELKRRVQREHLGLWMIWRDSTTLLDIMGQYSVLLYWQRRSYKVWNAGLPIIVAHVVLFKIIIFLMCDFIKFKGEN